MYSDEDPHYITPDVYVHKVGDKYFVVPNDDGLPKPLLSENHEYALRATSSIDDLRCIMRKRDWDNHTGKMG